MRPMPLITAVLVVGVLVALILQRDKLMEFAGVDVREQSPTEVADTGVAESEPEDDGIKRVSVVAMASTAEVIDRGVIVRGRTEVLRQVDVTAEVSGTVISHPLRRGTFVTAGQVMCEIDPGTRPAALAEARARLAEAEINAVAAERLAEGGFASETRKIGADATLQAAQALVEGAERQIADLTMRAPFDGVLENDTAELGALLSPGNPGGAVCGTVLQLDPIKVVGFVPETLVESVVVGATAGAQRINGEEIVGTVRFVSRSADESTRTFRVEVEVPNPDLKIRAGETAQIAIAAEGAPAHLVPASALTLDDVGRLGVRHVIQGEYGAEAEFAEVRVIRDTLQGFWVSGLPDTIDIIVVGQDFVTRGTPLKVTMQDSAS